MKSPNKDIRIESNQPSPSPSASRRYRTFQSGVLSFSRSFTTPTMKLPNQSFKFLMRRVTRLTVWNALFPNDLTFTWVSRERTCYGSFQRQVDSGICMNLMYHQSLFIGAKVGMFRMSLTKPLQTRT
eukprot:34883_6